MGRYNFYLLIVVFIFTHITLFPLAASAEDVLGLYHKDKLCCPGGEVCSHGICLNGNKRGTWCGGADKHKKSKAVIKSLAFDPYKKYTAPPKITWLK